MQSHTVAAHEATPVVQLAGFRLHIPHEMLLPLLPFFLEVNETTGIIAIVVVATIILMTVRYRQFQISRNTVKTHDDSLVVGDDFHLSGFVSSCPDLSIIVLFWRFLTIIVNICLYLP